MLLDDDEIKERIESPLNLLNRLKSGLGRTSVPLSNTTPPQLPPKSSDIIPDLEDKILNSTAKSKAMGIMTSAMNQLEHRIPEVQKPETLARIATEMSKIISNQEAKANNIGSLSQIIVYAPQIQPLENFEVIDANE